MKYLLGLRIARDDISVGLDGSLDLGLIEVDDVAIFLEHIHLNITFRSHLSRISSHKFDKLPTVCDLRK